MYNCARINAYSHMRDKVRTSKPHNKDIYKTKKAKQIHSNNTRRLKEENEIKTFLI